MAEPALEKGMGRNEKKGWGEMNGRKEERASHKAPKSGALLASFSGEATPCRRQLVDGLHSSQCRPFWCI